MTTTHQQVKKGDRVSHAVAGYVTSHGTSYPAAPALQRKSTDDEEVQLKSVAQLASPEEEELQMKSAVPLKNHAAGKVSQRKDNATLPGTNHTGMPDQLKTGIENLSGYSMDDVKVHYNSSQPAQLNALAYAQGTDIHVAPGEERHLPHEAWHVVQQKQGRVRPTMQMKGGVNVNDDKGLENEADVMGGKALKVVETSGFNFGYPSENLASYSRVAQAKKTKLFDVEKKYAAKVADYSEYKDLDQKAYNELIYDKLSAIYDVNLNKGTGYWGNLKKAIASFKAEDNTEFLKEQNEKHADYDLKFNKNYVSKATESQDTEDISVSSSGLANKRDKAYKKKDIPYSNHVNFEDDSITASHNYAERDRAREQDVRKKGKKRYKPRGLPNSEILWQQYKLAAKSQVEPSKDSKKAKELMNAKVKELVEGLSVVKRRQVQNASTQMTLLFALPNNKTNLETAYTWQAESEDFLAILGTPNCSGVAFLLADHVDELDGKSITEIELLGGNDVNLDIKIG